LSVPSLLLLPGTEIPACCEDERWAPIPGWPHESSTCGRARSTDRLGGDGIWRLGAMLPPQRDKRPGKGYLYYDLRDGERRRRIPAAVAVLEAHDKPRPGPEYEACHGNGRTDNHLCYLRWDTKAANLAEMWEERRQREAVGEFVTTMAADRSPEAWTGHKSQVGTGRRASRRPVTAAVTGDPSHGTGSPPSIPVFPSYSMSLKPSLSTIRTSFRTLRTLGRAS
jgi:hypothetical protein